jgi:hypothetical protein
MCRDCGPNVRDNLGLAIVLLPLGVVGLLLLLFT